MTTELAEPRPDQVSAVTTLSTTGRRAAKKAVRLAAEATVAGRVLPDFLLIGGKRCGSTSLYRYLTDHPAVVPMVPAREHIKGLYYFAQHYDRGPRWYRSHFPTRSTMSAVARRHGVAVTGEASPYYLGHPLAAQRAATALPDVRILVVLRDPVERAFSHYREQVRRGREPLTFAEALDAETHRLAGEHQRLVDNPSYYSRAHEHHAYATRGRYADNLEDWLTRYPSERVLVLRSEDFFADPQSAYDAVTDFLGLPRHRLEATPKHNFRGAAVMDPAVRERLMRYYEEPNRRLERMLGREMGWSS